MHDFGSIQIGTLVGGSLFVVVVAYEKRDCWTKGAESVKIFLTPSGVDVCVGKVSKQAEEEKKKKEDTKRLCVYVCASKMPKCLLVNVKDVVVVVVVVEPLASTRYRAEDWERKRETLGSSCLPLASTFPNYHVQFSRHEREKLRVFLAIFGCGCELRVCRHNRGVCVMT